MKKFEKWVFPRIRRMTPKLLTMELVSTQVMARPRKLRARWRAERDQDLVAFHGIDLNDETTPYPSMKQVKVSKAQLLEILKKNRSEHRDIFLEAQKKFREVAIKALDQQLALARSGKQFVLSRLLTLRAPEDHTKEYDRAIQMLEMSVDTEIIINEQEFQNFVQDIWHWSRDWATSNIGYVSRSSTGFNKLSALASTDE